MANGVRPPSRSAGEAARSSAPRAPATPRVRRDRESRRCPSSVSTGSKTAARGCPRRSRRALENPRDAFLEERGRRQQTHDEECLPREVEEEAGVRDDTVALEELEDERLFAA